MKAIPRTLQGRTLLAFAFLAASIPAMSQLANPQAVSNPVVPQIASHAGTATDRAGETVEMVFSIYSAAEGGEPLWSETQLVSVGQDGKYSVLLGTATESGLPQAVFAVGTARWLGVSIERGAELSRVPFASVAYAMKAADAQTLAGIPAAEFVTRKQFAQLAHAMLQPVPPENSDLQPNTTGTVTGSGTAGTIPLWTGALTQGNSAITQVGTDIGINEATPTATLDVNGTENVRGVLSLPPLVTATTTAGQRSQLIQLSASSWSSTFSAALTPTFKILNNVVNNNTSSAGGQLEFHYQNGPASVNVLTIAGTGVITFAPSQTFPGTLKSVAATSPVTATTTSGVVSLGLNTTSLETTLNAVYPQLGAANTFVGSQAITGNLTASGTETVQGEGTFGANGTTATGLLATGTTTGVTGNTSSTAAGSTGVFGGATAATGQVTGVTGSTSSSTNFAAGVQAFEGASSGNTMGVLATVLSNNGYGVLASAVSATGYTVGVVGQSASTSGIGVQGTASASTGAVFGVQGSTGSGTAGASGVNGYNYSATGVVNGVTGSVVSATNNAAGVNGFDNATSGVVYGVEGSTASGTNGASGVNGFDSATTGAVFGVTGSSSSSTNGAAGVNGFNNATTGVVYGVLGATSSSASYAAGVQGNANATTGGAYGVYGITNSSGESAGVLGYASSTTGSPTGVSGYTASTNGGVGVYGQVLATSGEGTGVIGSAPDTTGFNFGVQGLAGKNGVGVQGTSPNMAVAAFNQSCNSSGCTLAPGTAGQFVTGSGGLILQGLSGSGAPGNTTQVFSVDSSGNGTYAGNLNVTGKLTKGSGSFKIDHPLDPANKYLSHSFVESPDMMNVYNGNIVTDKRGLATVTLPDYFEALNRDFRYQLTVIGQFAQAIVAQEIDKNHFVIRTSKPGVKVSWQVTGIRQDAYANANRIPTEEDKPASEQGFYLHPEVFGQPASKSIMAAAKPVAHPSAGGVNSR